MINECHFKTLEMHLHHETKMLNVKEYEVLISTQFLRNSVVADSVKLAGVQNLCVSWYSQRYYAEWEILHDCAKYVVRVLSDL